MENDANVFFLNQTSFDEVLINGVFLNPNSQIGTFYGVVSKNNQNNWMKAIKGQSFNLIKIVKNEDFYYLICSNMIPNLIIQKIDLNGNIIWSKRFNQIEKAHLIHDCKIINNTIYFGLEVQSKVVGESKQIFAIDTNGKLLWLKKLNNTSLQCSTVGIDGIWLVSQVESTKLLICKLDFYGNIVLEKYYETNSTIKFMYDPCAKTDGGLLLKFGFSISDILLLSADKFADIIFTKKIIGDRHNTSNISENNGYIFYCHHQVSKLAQGYLRSSKLRAGPALRRMLSLLDVGDASEADLASYLLFDGGFARRLIELGRADAEAQRATMDAFFDDAEQA